MFGLVVNVLLVLLFEFVVKQIELVERSSLMSDWGVAAYEVVPGLYPIRMPYAAYHLLTSSLLMDL